MTRRLVLLVALLLAPLALRAQVLPTTRVVDGVQIREHRGDAFARAPKLSLSSAPISVLGGADADPNYDLTYASYVVILTDGRVATLAGIGNKFFIWKADGTPQKTIGRQGQGPGEWMRPTGLVQLAGDTLLLPDAANVRFSWVLADKGVVRDTSAGAAFIHDASRVAGILPGNRVVLTSSGLMPPRIAQSPARSDASIEWTTFDGDVPKVIAKVPSLDLLNHETRYRGRVNVSPTTFGFTRFAHIVVWDSVVAVGTGDGYRIDMLDVSGRRTGRIVVAVPRRAVTQPMRIAIIDQQLKRLEEPRGEGLVDAAESRRLIREQVFADSLPPYQNMFVTPNKTLWVVDAVAPTDTSWSATAFRKDGAIIGRLQVRGKGTPVAFSNDRVAVRTTDEDGVVSIRVYRIRVVAGGA